MPRTRGEAPVKRTPPYNESGGAEAPSDGGRCGATATCRRIQPERGHAMRANLLVALLFGGLVVFAACAAPQAARPLEPVLARAHLLLARCFITT